jgi:hypothetical protein
MIKKLFVTTCILFLSACTSVYTLVEANESPITLRGMSFSSSIDWSQLNKRWVDSSVADMWTIDGVSLNQLYVFGQVNDGDALFNQNGKERVIPKYASDMLPNEISELLVSSFNHRHGGDLAIDISGLRPQPFGDKAGFSFEVSFFNKEGLFIKGKAFSAVYNKQLYMLFYLAPNLHYYSENIQEVESMMSSVKVL